MGRHRQDEAVAFIPLGAPGTFVPGTFDNNLSDWFGTLRARAGVAFDRVLIYATGGLAYTDNNTGWVAGGGVEWALPGIGSAPRLRGTFGLEGLWVSVDNDDDNFNASDRHLHAGRWTPRYVIAPDRTMTMSSSRSRQAELQVRHLLSPHNTALGISRITPGLFHWPDAWPCLRPVGPKWERPRPSSERILWSRPPARACPHGKLSQTSKT